MLGVRAVEEREVGVRVEALHHQVDRPVLGRVDRLELVVGREAPGVHGRKRVRARTVEGEVAAEGEQAVTQGLGVECAAVEPPVPGVSRVGGRVGRVVFGGELVGFREHDPPVHGLDRPARGNEIGGQPIEQFGVGGRRPARPKSEGVGTIGLPK